MSAQTLISDDSVAAFHLDGAPVRGRYARLDGATIDAILHRHDYPRPVALLLGEALTLVALIGSLLNIEGRLVLQAEGEGLVSMLVAEWRSGGALRGYARLSEEARATLARENAMAPAKLLGNGALALTLDQGAERPRHQGFVALTGDTLAACAEAYFEQSEQTPTRIKLTVAEEYERGTRAGYRAGGALIQRVAGDTARGDTDEDWSRATILLATLTEQELVDPALGADVILYRLFHEEGVRMNAPETLEDKCDCDRERLVTVMKRFSDEELAGMVELDGLLHARCEFCSRTYLVAPEDLRR